MFHPVARAARRRWLPCLVALLVSGALAATPPAAKAAIVRVEEDWELVVAEPDPDSASPQVTCAISPQGDIASLHASFELNQRSLPEFQAGGLQLQLWTGETLLTQVDASDVALMATPGETVRWTQSMTLANETLTFQVSGGSSTTWGGFGGEDALRIAVPTSLANLDGYDPGVSARNSGIGYAANRVQSLVLKRVRYYMSDGTVRVDDTERPVHQQQ